MRQMEDINIKKSVRSDAERLTNLTIRSKSHWNYGAKQMEEWKEELTITESYIEENHIYQLEINDTLVGFYAFKAQNEIDIKLNFFFVEPAYIGKGYGKLLMLDFFNRVEADEFERVILDADPNAEHFYTKLGFRAVGRLKSSIKDRYLPIMEIKKDKLKIP